jgi:hypothetical protein
MALDLKSECQNCIGFGNVRMDYYVNLSNLVEGRLNSGHITATYLSDRTIVRWELVGSNREERGVCPPRMVYPPISTKRSRSRSGQEEA